ncbi:putative tellurite resistance protein B-like protein [Kushneria sinocarnis]|uniref:Putative tellurite resistance protein B-like protein n=1 Tax=Kushneria sinocarnis TaxID=595502 RepID=A0A420WV37_9GAMM|nr:TerB family tellurite resistance protein [Kushneria sinocarnis]RKR02394.1 putative tellurite resistance protein B-like protein [Kushneria sinocarnis]
MLDAIQNFFDRMVARPDAANDAELTLELATAALMCEIIRADGKVDDEERMALTRMLQRRFSLDEQAVDELVRLALQEAEESVDHYQFVRLINDRYDYQRKTALVQRMWQLAYADGELDPQEEARVRKLAELLHVEHHDFINAKLRAWQVLGLD